MSSFKKIFRKTGRLLLWILLGLVSLILLVYIFINTPYGKTVVKNQLVSFLAKKLDTKITAESVDYSLPNWIKLKNVYVEDQHKDTLLFGGALGLDISMLKLINGEIDISKISFENIVGKINRPASDSVFNYQFVLDAFTTGGPPKTVKQDTSGLKLTLKELILKNVVLNMNDAYAGNNMSAFVGNARLTTKTFQPDKLKFYLDELDIDGLRFTMNSFTGSMIPDSVIVIDTTAAQENGLFISGNRLKLRNAYVNINNEVSGLHYENDIGNFGMTNVLFNLSQSVGTADSIYIDSSNFIFKSALASKAKIDTIISNTPPWFLKVANLYINETDFKYDDVNKRAVDGLDFAHLQVSSLKTGINDFMFSSDTTRALVTQLRFEDESGFKLDTMYAAFAMTDRQLVANEVYINTPRSLIKSNFLLTYDSIAAITKNPRNSFITTTLDRSRIAFKDIYFLVPALKASLPPAQFAGQYLDVNTKLQGNLATLNIPYLQIVGLTGSKISARGVLYNLTDAKRFSYDLQILSSTFYKRDLVKLLPPEQVAQLKGLPEVINLTGKFKGDLNNIGGYINSNAKDFAFNGNFKLSNISDPTNLKYDFQFGSLSLTKSLILGFLPPTVIAQLNLPNRISAKGKLSGNSNNLVADLAVASSYGNAKIKGYINNIKDPTKSKYDLAISTGGFNVGRLIRQDSVLGNVAGNFKLKGTSFDVNTMQSDIAANMSRLDYKGYSYSDIDVIAKVNQGLISAKGSANDPNARLSFDVNANIKNEYPTINGTIQIDTMQLQNLKLYDSMFNFSGLVNLDVKSLVPRKLDADVYVETLRMQFAGVRYFIDTIALNASNQNGIDSIRFTAPFANLTAAGAFDYDKIGTSLQQYINNYYKLPGVPVKLPSDYAQQQISFNGNIQEHPLVKAFVPGLISFSNIDFSGSYNSNIADSALNFNASIPALQYQNYTLSEGTIGIESTNEQINYDINFDTLNTGTKLLYGTFIRGAAAKDSISLNAKTQDDKNRDWFGLAGTASVKGEEYNFTLKDSLILNYENWNVQKDNFISYSEQGILVQNVRLSNDTSVISINSVSPVRNSPIEINVKDFDLATIASIASGDTLLASGVLNVKANVSDFNKKLPAFTGTAEIKNLQVYQSPVGNITATADKVNDGEIKASMRLDGNGNDVNANLNYYLNNTSNQFNAKVDINALSFRTIQAFSAGQLINSSGNITGDIVANGKFADPRWNGQLGFDTVRFTPTQLGTPYFIDKQKIVLEYPRVLFPKFTLTDSLQHTLVVDGDIRTNSKFDIFLDLKVKADDFTVVNAKRAIGSQFFGYAAIDADVDVGGTGIAPTIEGSIYVNDKSDLTVLLPEANYAKQSGNELVRFIDRDTFEINPPVVLFNEGKDPNKAFAQFLNYNLNIQINKEAEFTIVLDPITGDEIKVQGDARLNAGVDPGGNIVLAGVYNLDKGYYDFNYQFINRKFLLNRGSTIRFAGDPLDAVVDITASYIASTTAESLLSNEISNADPTLVNGLRQKLPFEVKLTLTGELNKPKIKFDIILPDEGANVNSNVRSTIESKLAQIRDDEAAMNREVFSLLLFGRFVGEQSSDFFKGNGGGFSDIARQSVSQFLNEALDEIAGNVIKGVNVDLNLNSYNDYSSGNATNRTDLNIAVSKSFLNDRLTVSVGQNFGLEGQDAATKAAGKEPGFKPDISLGYKLTEDGRYLLRAYTKNQYEATVDGYVVETGLSFVLTLDYDKFKELFQSRKKK